MRTAFPFVIRPKLKPSLLRHIWPSAGFCDNRYGTDDERLMDHQESLLFGSISDESLLGLPSPASVEDEEEEQDSCSPRKFRLGKLDQFHRLLDEMRDKGTTPDLHTYNLLLHVLGKGDKPLAAVELLNYMTDVGCHPSVLHFTNLIDGLSRAGNLEACNYFFDEMIKKGCEPDVVCYTVMITGYTVAGEFERVKRSDRIIVKGHTGGRGRPKLTLDSVIQKVMRVLNISKHDALDRVHWRSRIHVADPK